MKDFNKSDACMEEASILPCSEKAKVAEGKICSSFLFMEDWSHDQMIYY